MKKINDLNKEKQEYIKEKQIIEQKLNKKEQELNEKKQELTNNKIKINDLKLQNKLLNEGLDDSKKSNDLKNKENNELRDKISKLKEVKIDKDSSTMPKMFQDVRKRDDKVRTFAPKEPGIYQTIENVDGLPEYDEESDRLKKLKEEYMDTTEENPYISDSTGKPKKINLKYTEKFMKKGLREFYKNELKISNARIKYFNRIINKNPEMPTKTIDIINGLKYLYIVREKYFENRVNNEPKRNESVDLVSVDDEIRKLQNKLRNQEGSGTFTKNNSKKLKDGINQILKKLYNSKQITKQVYNTLNKALMSTTFTKNDS